MFQTSSNSISGQDELLSFRGEDATRENWSHYRRAKQCRATQQVEGVIAYMLKNLDKPLRVSTLAALAGVSSPHFFALFKSATGFAPMDFFIRLRMRRACQLLMNPLVTVKEVAAALGYEDQFYFSRLFKSIIGIAPRDYRQSVIAPPSRWDPINSMVHI